MSQYHSPLRIQDSLYLNLQHNEKRNKVEKKIPFFS